MQGRQADMNQLLNLIGKGENLKNPIDISMFFRTDKKQIAQMQIQLHFSFKR